MKFCSSGVAPEVGFAGENFKAGTHRANMIGKPLAGGKWRCLDSFLQEMFSHCSMVAYGSNVFLHNNFSRVLGRTSTQGMLFCFQSGFEGKA